MHKLGIIGLGNVGSTLANNLVQSGAVDELVLIDNIFEKLSQDEYEKVAETIRKQFLQNKTTTIIATTSSSIAKDLTKRTIRFKLGSIEE